MTFSPTRLVSTHRFASGRELAPDGENFLRSFLRLDEILLQNCVILRRALQTDLIRRPYQKHAAQRCEKLRNSLGLNYKSAALPAELCRRCPYESRFSEFIKSSSMIATHDE